MFAWVTGKEGQLQTLKGILIYIAASCTSHTLTAGNMLSG